MHQRDRIDLDILAARQSNGLLTRYVVHLSPLVLGVALMVFIQIAIEPTSPTRFEAFCEAVQAIPEIEECHTAASSPQGARLRRA